MKQGQVRPRPKAQPKNKIPHQGKWPHFPWLKVQIFIKLYFFLKVVHFFIIDVKDTTNFTIGLQIVILLITKKLYKYSLVKLMKFINDNQCHIIF